MKVHGFKYSDSPAVAIYYLKWDQEGSSSNVKQFVELS